MEPKRTPRSTIRSERETRDRGFVMITFGLLLIPIVIFTALAIDVSSWYSRATELQRSADAAALAGVVWMPDLGTAQGAATPVLARNNITAGGKYSVSMSTGASSAASFKVCVTDSHVTQYFSSIFSSGTSITRCATAEYNSPLQLGSPLNYFGGNQSLSSYIPGTPPANAIPVVPPYSAFKQGYSYNNYCSVTNGVSIVGYWYRNNSSNSSNWSFIWGNISGAPACGTPAPAVPDVDSFTGGRICSVRNGGSKVGYWDTRNAGNSSGWRYYPTAYGNSPDCGWNGATNSPIPASKSPNMWAAVESYNYGHANGDAYSNAGAEHRDTGYWYSVDVAAGETGNLSIQAFDLTYNRILTDSSTGRSPTGDNAGGSGGTPVRMVVYKAGAMKYDMSTITAVSGCDTGWLSGTSNPAYDLRWNEVCNISSPSVGDRYYINILSNDGTNGLSGQGVTGYAVRAVAGSYPAACLDTMPAGNVACYGTGTQPNLAAYGDMEMYNGIPQGQPTEFYLANVTPMYAGKTLEISLFDPGDGAPESWVTVMAPSASSTLGTPASSSACSVMSRPYGSTSWSNVPLSTGPSGAYSGTCTVQTSNNSSNAYNDQWLRFRIPLPSTYGTSGTSPWYCDPTVSDPVNNAGSCWWQIKYFTQNGNLADYTTWSARIIGDPVRLTM